MSLREELAKRLYEAHWGPTMKLSVASGRSLAELRGANLTAWLMVADECIRQMEWARRSQSVEVFEPSVGLAAYYAYHTLTLAPPDWKP